jgi:alpha-ribazole phosphatase
MERTRLYLIRHGQVEGFEEKRYNGQENVPLTPLGKVQSDRVCTCLREIPLDAVYSSDLDRSHYCAKLIAATHELEAKTEESLRELHVGDWQGRTWAELQEAYPEDWQARLKNLVNFQVPGGESLQDAADRIRPTIRNILDKHRGGDIAVVAHGGVNRIILLDAFSASLEKAFSIEQDYGCLNIIDYFAGGNAVVRLLNDTAHQRESGGAAGSPRGEPSDLTSKWAKR